jgi:DHA2 family multidrug resistance protein-like MFS transporter
VLAAFSTTPAMLIAARALLGVAGATLAPSTLSLIRNMFHDPQQRTTAIGVWISSYSLGGAIGPLVGGLMLEFFWWGSVFLIAVPVMVALLIVGPKLLPEYRDPQAGRPDLLSAAMSLVAVLGVIFGLKEIAQDGVALVPVLSIVAGFAIGALFVARQNALADPLLDLGLFKMRAFSAALAPYALAIIVMFGGFLFLPQFLQLVLGLSPLEAGLWTVPWALAFVAGAFLTPVATRYMRPAYAMAGGMLLATVGLAMMTQLDETSGFVVFLIASVVWGIGFAPTFTLTNEMIVSSAPPERAGAAAAISETGAEFGGALGIALFGSLGVAVYRGAMDGAVPAGVPPEAAEVARDTLGGAVAVAGQLPEAVGVQLLTAASDAFIQGLQLSATISTIGAIALALFVAIALRHVRTGGGHDAGEIGEARAAAGELAPELVRTEGS